MSRKFHDVVALLALIVGITGLAISLSNALNGLPESVLARMMVVGMAFVSILLVAILLFLATPKME